jgi:hypothetical protein
MNFRKDAEMKNPAVLITKALISTTILISLHLLLIYVLGIRIEGWNHAVLSDLKQVYAIPVILVCINYIIFFRVNILKYKLIWWLANLVPGFIFLSVSRVTYDASKAEEDFLGLLGYDFQLIALLPFIYFVLQLFLLYVWKVERRNDQDKY